MELSNLKTLRRIIPGTIFTFLSIPFYINFIAEQTQNSEALKFPLESYGPILTFIIGTLLSQTGMRNKVLKQSLEKINGNIFNRLHEISYGQSTQGKIFSSEKQRKMMRIFYHLIDNDESLKEKAKLVRDNGLIWSSIADAIWLGALFSFLYLVLAYISTFYAPDKTFALTITSIILLFIALILCGLVLPKIHKEHIKLGNEQLDIIEQFYKQKTKELLKEHEI